MENLKVELGSVLGEPLSRMQQVSEQPYAHLYSLYNKAGTALPILAKAYVCQGIAQQESYKLSLLAREGNIRLPIVYGIVSFDHGLYREMLLLERLPGISVEAPTRTPERWGVLMDQIIESLLAWRRVDSRGCVGMVDACQENQWGNWYQHRIDVLWAALNKTVADKLDYQDRCVLLRSKLCMNKLFEDFDDSAVLVHGNITLRSMLKDARSDQLLSMLNPGVMLWAPREYELFRLCSEGMPTQLFFRYLERAPVSESFIARRWFYVLWEAVSRYLHTGSLNQPAFKRASQYLVPWLG